MASIVASLPPSLLLRGRKTTLLSNFRKPRFSSTGEKLNPTSVAVKASGESSESSTSLSIVESVQNVWDKSEDRLALVGLGFAAIVALWTSTNLITAIEKLPVVPSALEVIGILFSSWFTYRYLLFKPDREELFQILKKSIFDILGQ